MIKKCLVVLAVVAQISAFRPEYGMQNSRTFGKSSGDRLEFSYPVPVSGKDKAERSSEPKSGGAASNSITSQNSMYKPSGFNATPTTKNLIAKGRYSVALQNYGPAPDKKIPVYTTHVRVPVQEKPTVRLPTKIPAPKTVAHTCTCFKTIVKPRIHQTLITVPSIQRYIETLHRPVVENIHYEACPLKTGESGPQSQTEEPSPAQAFQFSSTETSQAVTQAPQVSPMKMQSFEAPRVQIFDISKLLSERDAAKTPKPQTESSNVQIIEAQKPQIIEIPRIQFIEAKPPQKQEHEKKTQTIQLPRIQFIEAQKPQVEFPCLQFVESQKPQFIEMPLQQFTGAQNNGIQKIQNIEFPSIQVIEAKKPQSVEKPRVQYEDAHKSQSIELPRVQFVDVEKFQTVEIPHPQEEATKEETSQQGGSFSFGSGATQSGQLFIKHLF